MEKPSPETLSPHQKDVNGRRQVVGVEGSPGFCKERKKEYGASEDDRGTFIGLVVTSTKRWTKATKRSSGGRVLLFFY